jgi:hypothetical protein
MMDGDLPEKLLDIIRAAPELGATLLMIDAPSRLDPVALAAIRVSDLVVCPAATDLLNLAPLQETVALIETADKLGAAVGVLNNIDGVAKRSSMPGASSLPSRWQWPRPRSCTCRSSHQPTTKARR